MEGTEQVEARPSPRQVKGTGVLLLLFSALPSVRALQLNGFCTSCACSWAGQFSAREDSSFRRQGMLGSRDSTLAWHRTDVRDRPDISALHLEGSQWSGPSIPDESGGLALFQRCPNRLLMGCLQAGLRQAGRQ